MTNEICVVGKVHFDPADVSKKHERQSEWKRVAIVQFDGEDHLYYAWFIRRRYGLSLNRPLRGFHVTFVNDRSADMAVGAWDRVKSAWSGSKIEIRMSTDMRTNGEHWWLKITDPGKMSSIRAQLGLDPVPYFSYHATVGYANERNIVDSERIHRLILKGLIT